MPTPKPTIKEAPKPDDRRMPALPKRPLPIRTR